MTASYLPPRVRPVLAWVVLNAACGAPPEGSARALQPLPFPVTNNAVAVLVQGGEITVFSFLGLDSTKRWDGISQRGFRAPLSTGQWEELPTVPGPVGRLAATAQAVRGRVLLFGGYTVDSTGAEHSVAAVDIFHPSTGTWSAGAPMPIPVDDAVSGVWRDSLVYLVSGWHDRDNVQDVQIYDPTLDRWSAATPIPGPGVFGHTGGLAGDAIVFVDGVARRPAGELPPFGLVPQAWLGEIDPFAPERITWRALPAHPGSAVYRAAAAPCGDQVVFWGGSQNPYNYDGVGYDGRLSAPEGFRFSWSMTGAAWGDTATGPVPTMDHRGLIHSSGRAWVLGGMRVSQKVSAEATPVSLPAC